MAMKYLNNNVAIFNSFGEDVYMSDFVNNCIDRIATEISKIDIRSIIDCDGKILVQNDDITRLLKYKPNPLQTTKDFLSCCEWLRRKDGNCFIYPQYKIVNGTKRFTALYPLNPKKIEIGISKGNVWEIKFFFKDGSEFILPYSELIHLRWRRGKNTVIGGGDDRGQRNTDDLLKSVETLDKVLQGLPKSIEASLKINGVYSAKAVVDAAKLEKEKERFEEHIFESKTGIVATDLSGEFVPIRMTPSQIDPIVLKFLKSIIRERYGISEAILSGDYDGENHSAFYQSCIEDFIIEFEQSASACMFNDKELNKGHRIKCYYSKVAYLNISDKIKLAELAKDVGNITLNQMNEMLGFLPFNEGDRRVQSLNYVNVELIDKYQLNKGGGKDGEESEK
ncbi:MAG: phage portal protein [Clostridium sp.]|nr:phage portal protein [Clostridium sp.]